MTEREFSRILGWPGYKVYRHEIDEAKRALRLWVRRKRGNKILTCGNCGGRAERVINVREREIRDVPWRKYETWQLVEYCRVNCPKCGLRTERVEVRCRARPHSARTSRISRTGLRLSPGSASGQALWLGGQHGAGD